jgi:SAM-dependent methyltransferase
MTNFHKFHNFGESPLTEGDLCRRLSQFLPDSPIPPSHACDGSGHFRSRLEPRGNHRAAVKFHVPEPDSAHPDFWTARYAARKTPWDFGGVPASLIRFLTRMPGNGRVLIPGCGTGYEVAAFHRAGRDVTALDFSPVAVKHAREILGDLGPAVVLGDFFTHDFGPGAFDLIYERAFLCSLPLMRWNAYARRMAYLLRPKARLIGIFLYGDEPEPPPHPLTDSAAKQLFAGRFELTHTETITDSLPVFQGKERWQEWTRV